MESRRVMGKSTAVLVVLVLAMACRIEEHPVRAPADPDVAEQAGVVAELEAYYRDFSARDWEAFASHFWPGADVTTAWQPPGETAVRVVVTPVPEFVAQAPSGPGSREIFEETMLDATVTIAGDLAQAWVRYRARFGDAGNVAEWEGIDAFILLRLNGVWKIVELAFVPETEPGS